MVNSELKTKLECARAVMREELLSAKNPVMAVSFGKDSLLTLFLAREIVLDIPCVAFNAFWPPASLEFVKKIVHEWKLTVFFYAPTDARIYEPKAGEKSVVTYYSIGNQTLPVVQDVIENPEICGYNLIDRALAPGRRLPFYLWDLTLTGSRSADSHSLVPALELSPLNNQSHKFFSPLWNWTDAEVWEAIELLEIPVSAEVYADNRTHFDTGCFHACTRCLTRFEPTVFCPKDNREIPAFFTNITK